MIIKVHYFAGATVILNSRNKPPPNLFCLYHCQLLILTRTRLKVTHDKRIPTGYSEQEQHRLHHHRRESSRRSQRIQSLPPPSWRSSRLVSTSRDTRLPFQSRWTRFSRRLCRPYQQTLWRYTSGGTVVDSRVNHNVMQGSNELKCHLPGNLLTLYRVVPSGKNNIQWRANTDEMASSRSGYPSANFCPPWNVVQLFTDKWSKLVSGVK